MQTLNKLVTDLINVLKGIDDIIGEARQQVNHEPCLQVVHADQLGVRDDLTSRPHKCGVEVQDDVHQEDDVHYAVHHQPCHVVLLGLKRDIVGDHDGCVEGEDKDYPVPCGLEGAVM